MIYTPKTSFFCLAKMKIHHFLFIFLFFSQFLSFFKSKRKKLLYITENLSNLILENQIKLFFENLAISSEYKKTSNVVKIQNNFKFKCLFLSLI